MSNEKNCAEEENSFMTGLSANLHVAFISGMVQGSTASTIGDVQAVDKRHQHFGTQHVIVVGRNVQRRLPVLVTGSSISRVLEQCPYNLL